MKPLIANRFHDSLWTDVLLRSQALPALPAGVLLHAGSPLTNAIAIPAAIRQAAMEALLFEGWAENHEAAAQLFDQVRSYSAFACSDNPSAFQ